MISRPHPAENPTDSDQSGLIAKTMRGRKSHGLEQQYAPDKDGESVLNEGEETSKGGFISKGNQARLAIVLANG